MKLLVEDGLTTATGRIPHGGKLVGHGLAQSAHLAISGSDDVLGNSLGIIVSVNES